MADPNELTHQSARDCGRAFTRNGECIELWVDHESAMVIVRDKRDGDQLLGLALNVGHLEQLRAATGRALKAFGFDVQEVDRLAG